MLDLTSGYGAGAVLECVGTQDSMDTAFAVTWPGGIVGRVGVPHGVHLDAAGTFYWNIGLCCAGLQERRSTTVV